MERIDEMTSVFSNILTAVGVKLIYELIKGPESSEEIENKIIAAKSSDEIKEILKEEIARHIADADDEVIEGLVKAENTDDIIAVIEKPEVQKGIIDSLTRFLSGLIGLIFGKKNG